jgi:hypothetical protein
MGPAFIMMLASIASFFLVYTGHSKLDRGLGITAGIACLITAIFPVTSDIVFIKIAHIVGAGIFFMSVSFFSLFLFTKTDPKKEMTNAKKKRNIVYRVCGILMLTFFGLVILDSILGAVIPAFKVWAENVAITLILESLLLWAFGVSWFVKGYVLWKD